MSRLAYVAGPIDQADGRITNPSWHWVNARAGVQRDLNSLGYDVFRPDRAWRPGPKSHAIQTANNAVIDVSAAVVAVLPAGVPTLGTPVEIEYALARKIPTLIVTNISNSVQVDSWVQRGALHATPSTVGAGLLDLQVRARKREAEYAQVLAMNNLILRETRGAPSLVFERAELKWKDYDPADGIDLLPTRSYRDDAGLDLFVAEDFTVEGYSFADVPCGVKVDIPAGHWALITGRSSTLRKRSLLVNPGVIDAGWTGELFAGVQNMSGEPAIVKAGERLAQLILLPAPVVGYTPVWGRVPEKERGERGFGSSGV
jgi:dUTP pyrophosphatase